MLSILLTSLQQDYDVMYVNDSQSFHNCLQQNKNQTCILTQDLIVILKNNLTINNRSILGNNHNLTIVKSRNETIIINNSQLYNVNLGLQGNVYSFIDYQNQTQWFDCIITSLLDLNATTQNIILDSVDSSFTNCQFYLIQPQTLFALNIKRNNFINNTFEIYNSSIALISLNSVDTNYTNNAYFIQNMTTDMDIIKGNNNQLQNTIVRIAYSNNYTLTLNNSETICNVSNFFYQIYENEKQTMHLQQKQKDITNNYLYFMINQVPEFTNANDTFEDQNVPTLSLKLILTSESQNTIIYLQKLAYIFRNNCESNSLIYFSTLCLEDYCGLNQPYQCTTCSIDEDFIDDDNQNNVNEQQTTQSETYKFICKCQQNFNESTYCTSCYDKYIGGSCKIVRDVYGGVYTGLTILCLIIVIASYFYVQRKAIEQSSKAMKEVEVDDDSSSYL